MKLSRFVLVIMIFTIIACSVDTNTTKNDLKTLNLKGDVKSFREISYQAEDRFGKMRKGEKLREHSGDQDKYFVFNTDGYIVEKNLYWSDGSLIFKRICIHPTNQVYVNSKRFLKGDLIKTRLQVQVLRQ